VLANDTDIDGGPKSIASVTQPANGTSVITGGGSSLTYEPDPDFCNDGSPTDDFTYTLVPGGSTATVEVTVTCVDDPPQAVDDAATVTEDDPATAINVLANDTDIDGGPISISSASNPAGGTVVITGGGTGLTYEPDLNFCNDGSPTDDFTYTLAPGGSTATVEVTVTCVDDPPVAVDDAATVTEDDPATSIGVLANDTDIDGGPIDVSSTSDPAGGTVVVVLGVVLYEPEPDFCNDGSPTDDFTYTLTPGGSTATVRVTVTCVDDPPVAVDDAATVTEDDPATPIDVLGNDTDVDGGPISISSASDPAGGTVVITGGGTGLTYETDLNFCNDGSPTDDFTYTLAPGGSTATVEVTVTCVDDPPVAVDDAATVTEDDLATPINVLANDTDIDGGPKGIASVTQPANGTVVITGGGTGLTYGPDADYCNDGSPTDDFTYTLTPGGSTATVEVTVNCVNDPPSVVAPGPFDVLGNVFISVTDGADDLLANASDVEDPGSLPLFVGGTVPTSTTNGGDLSINTANGSFTYDPPAGFEGPDSFDYQVCDSGLPLPSQCSAPVTVTLNVSDMIWFVDSTASAGGDGRLSSPFDSLTGLGGFDPVAPDDAGDAIFLADGSYAGGLTLLNQQSLIGEGSSSDLASVLGLTVPIYSEALPALGGTDPTIIGSAGGLVLGQDNFLRGFDMSTTGGTALLGVSVNALVVAEVDTIQANSGLAIDLSGGVGMSVDIGDVTVTSSAAGGVRLDNNTGMVNFASVNLTTSGGTGFLATNSGTVRITGAANSISSTSGEGIHLLNTTIGGTGMTFQSISSTGATNGITLNNVGPNGFTIAGDGGSAQNGSGGTIQNTSGDGIVLVDVSNVELNQIAVSSTQRHGLFGDGVDNLTINNSTLQNVGNANDENAFEFRVGVGTSGAAITGTLTLNNVDVSNFYDSGLIVYNESGSLAIDIDDSDFSDNHDAFGADAIFVESEGTASIAMSVDGGVFNALEGDAVLFEAGSSGSNDVDLLNITSTNGGGPDNFPNGGGLELRVDNGATLTFDIKGNTITDLRGDALVISSASGTGGGNLEGRIGGASSADGNTFSGSALGDGIDLLLEGPASGSPGRSFTILIQNNDIGVDNTGGGFNDLGDDGIQIRHRDNRGTLNLTIEDNTIVNTGSEGIRFFSDEDLSLGSNMPVSNVRIADNSFSNICTGGGCAEAIVLLTRDTAKACFHIIGNDNGSGGSPGRMALDNSIGAATLQITQSSTGALATANNAATITTFGSITFNGTCTNPLLPAN
jgi:hypothetical protein